MSGVGQFLGAVVAVVVNDRHRRDRERMDTQAPAAVPSRTTRGPMSPAHALCAAGRDDAWIEAFYAALRAAQPADAKAMIDNPTGWTP